MKISEYNVVSLDNIDNVVDAFNERISEGWQPYGSMIVNTISDDEQRFTQTLVRYLQD